MRRYESVIILDPELSDDDVRNITERYTQIIKDRRGEVIKIEDWGSRKLAYLVKKKERGRYVLLDYVGLPDVLGELERQFKIADEVMKYLSVKTDDDVDLEAFKADAEQKASETAPAKPAKEESPAPVAAPVEGSEEEEEKASEPTLETVKEPPPEPEASAETAPEEPTETASTEVPETSPADAGTQPDEFAADAPERSTADDDKKEGE
jgi:small subunit ribosomal protein S6